MRLPIVAGLCALFLWTSPAAAQRGIGPDAAVGTVEERLASSIEFDSSGAFIFGEGFTASVTIRWGGTAAFIVRTVYSTATPAQLRDNVTEEAARAAFYNFAASALRVERPGDGGLPIAVSYDLREAMSFGNGGRGFSFYVPMLRAFRRIPPTQIPIEVSPDLLATLPEAVRKVVEATPPTGVLPVFEVGRMTCRATYQLPEGAWASAPEGRHIDTDFAEFTSTYAVEGRRILAVRTLIVKKLTLPLDREADLAAFYQAVEADRRQEFPITFVRPDARTEADALNLEGTAAIDRKALGEAVDILRKATERDSHHRWAWYNLGSAYLGLGNAAESIRALERALAVNPADPFVRTNLGQAYEQVGRLDDAEKILKAQVQRWPHSAWALQTIAGFYARRRNFAESVIYGERAADAAPDLDGTPLSLGHSYLELGRVDDAAKAFARGIRASRDGATLNEAAWTLAEKGAALDAAEKMIHAALAKIVARAPMAMPRPMPPLEATSRIAAMWDTAGWVYFKRGDAAQAVPWLESSWHLTYMGEVAEHLGDVFAKAGRTDDAAIAYAWAVAADRPALGAQPKLSAIAGDRLEAIHRTARERLEARRTLSFAGPASAAGEVLVVYERNGRPVRVEAAPTTTLGADVIQAVRSLTIPVMAPDERPYQLARTAKVACADGRCTLTWLTPTR